VSEFGRRDSEDGAASDRPARRDSTPRTGRSDAPRGDKRGTTGGRQDRGGRDGGYQGRPRRDDRGDRGTGAAGSAGGDARGKPPQRPRFGGDSKPRPAGAGGSREGRPEDRRTGGGFRDNRSDSRSDSRSDNKSGGFRSDDHRGGSRDERAPRTGGGSDRRPPFRDNREGPRTGGKPAERGAPVNRADRRSDNRTDDRRGSARDERPQRSSESRSSAPRSGGYSGDKRPSRDDRPTGSGDRRSDDRPQRSFDSRGGAPRSSDRRPSSDDRPQRSFDSRSSAPRSNDRRPSSDDRPQRSFDSRGGAPRTGGYSADRRPSRDDQSTGAPRSDRNSSDRSSSDRPQRSFDSRGGAPRTGGYSSDKRPSRDDRPSTGARSDRSSSDRPQRSFDNRDSTRSTGSGDRRPTGKDERRSSSYDRPARSDDRINTRPARDARPPRSDDRPGTDSLLARELLSAPELPDGIEFSDLDEDARRELRTLPKGLAETVGKHLVAAGGLMDSDPEAALAHAKYAKSKASRVPLVREALGLVAYHAGNWAEALSELRAVRRMTHTDEHIAIIADAERAVGRPERALDLAKEANLGALTKSIQVELAIVAAGARRDLGQLDAAVVALQGTDLDVRKRDPWTARLFYAYADNLAAAGRPEDAIQWFMNADAADENDETDAAERADELSNQSDEPAVADKDDSKDGTAEESAESDE
jgi:hypothetical protein